MSHADTLQRNHDVLQRCTTINFYVIDYLRAEEVLDEAQEHDLKTERNPLRQRVLLFQWLKEVSSDRYESFLQVMMDTEQEHVANLLTGSTKEDHLPLSDARYRRLVKIRHKMANVTRIDSEVIAELRSRRAISMTDAEEIRAEKVDSTKVSKLISVIMRRSNHSYNSFRDVLRKTLQTAAANFLSEGEMPALHINNNRPDLDGPLSRAVNDLIRSGTTDDAEMRDLLEDLNGLGLNPVKAIPGQSIVIFIYCKTVSSAVKFTQLFNSGRLQYIIDSILNRLLLTIEPHNMEELDSRISLEGEEIVTLEDFTGIEDWVREGQKRPKPSSDIYGCDAITQTEKSFMKKITGWMQERSYRPKPLGKIRVCDASTQTDEESFIMKLTARNVDYIFMKRKLEQTQEENYTLRELLQHQTLTAKNEDYFKMKRELEETQQENDKLMKLLQHQTLSGELPEKYKSDPILLQTIRITAAEEKNKSINGLAILDRELFVVSEDSSEVEVYDSMRFSFSRRWNLKELFDPYDIGSCSRNKCLYIINCKGIDQSNEILRVDPSGKLIKNWSTGDDFGDGLSVTHDSNVIFTVFVKNKLNEYSPDGQLIREIDLSSDTGILHPLHAIKLTNGNFVVSHGYLDDLHGVCIVDADGKLKKSFGGNVGITAGLMSDPVYLSVDGNGFVMVADLNNSRVLLLDSDLKFQREILSEVYHELRNPTRILLEDANCRLFVADNDWNDGQILIFQLK